MNKIYKLLIGTALVGLFSPIMGQTYDTGDLTALLKIRDNNFSSTTELDWSSANPSNWDGVTWDASNPRHVVELDLANRDANSDGSGLITDLRGSIDLTAFDSLFWLHLGKNTNLTAVNLTGLTKLRYVRLGRTAISGAIDLSNNQSMQDFRSNRTMISSVTFEGDTNITYVKVTNNTKLSSVNLTNCKNLNTAQLNENALKSLLVSGCTELTSLQVQRNNLTSLDVSNFSKLTSINVGKNTKLATLNLSGDTLLQNISLSRSLISSLDVSTFNNLYDLKVSNMPNLKSLDLTNRTNLTYFKSKDRNNSGLNNLETVNFSGCTNLQRIRIVGSKIATIDLSSCPNIDRVGAKNSDVKTVIGYISNTPSKIRIQNNHLNLTQTVQINNIVADRVVSNQTNAYPKQKIALGGTVDYSAEASIDSDGAGTMTTTTFTLYDYNGNYQADNTTGLFTINTAGGYYVELSNDGITMNTGYITVGDVTPDPSYSIDDYNVLMDIYANNLSQSNINWDFVSNLEDMDGVNWNSTSPRRVTNLNLRAIDCNNSVGDFVVTGAIDFNELTELAYLNVGQQPNFTSIKVNELTKLVSLGLGHNGLTSLSVKDLTNLYNLRSSNNPALLSVDANGCTNLNYIRIRNNSKLSILKMKDCDNLYSMDLSSNKFTTLALKDFPILSYVYIPNNLLGSLDFTGSPNVRNISASNNNISSVKYDDSNIIYSLYLENNTKLKSLDIDNLPNINYLNIGNTSIRDIQFNDHSNLYNLSIQDGGVKNLVIENCPNLYEVNARRNADLVSIKLTGNLDNFYHLHAGRSKNLKSVDLTGMTVSDNDIYSLSFSESAISEVKGIVGTPIVIGKINTRNTTDMTITGLVQALNERTGTNGRNYDQFGYRFDPILLGDSIDLSSEATVDVNGSPSTTTFTLYYSWGGFVSSNTTGIIKPTLVSDYYMTLSNNGSTVRSYYFSVKDSTITGSYIMPNGAQNFGNVLIGQTSTGTITVKNLGNDTLKISDVIISTGFSINNKTATILAGDSANFTVTFSPTAHMRYSGSVYFVSNANDGVALHEITGNGIDPTFGIQEENTKFVIYPNPTTDMIVVKDYMGENKNFGIYSIVGSKVGQVNIARNPIIDVRNLENGIYILQSVDGKFAERFIKQ